jgi:hypothetical protein
MFGAKQKLLNWEVVLAITIKVPTSFTNSTLQQVYNNIEGLMSGSRCCNNSGSDYSTDIQVLQAAVAVIPPTFNNTEWSLLVSMVMTFHTPGIDLLKTSTLAEVFNAVKKVPIGYNITTLQLMYDNVKVTTWTEATNAAKKVPSVFVVDTLQ